MIVTSDFRPEVEIQPFLACAMKNTQITLIYGRITKIFASFRKSGSGNTIWWRQIFHRKWKYGRFAHAQWKIRNIRLIYGRIAQIFASFRKSGSRNTMVTSDVSPEVEIRPFRRFAHVQCIRPKLLEQFVHYGRGYGADTTFHRTHF